MPGLEAVTGLASLVAYFSQEAQEAALRWCLDKEVSEVELIVDLEWEDEFVRALGLRNSDGAMAASARKRLAAVGASMRAA